MSSSTTGIAGITFDFWNTLVTEARSADHRTQRWVSALHSHGVEISAAELESGLALMWEWFQRRWEGNQVVTPEAAVDFAIEAMAVESSPPLRDSMIAALHDGFDPAEMEIAPGIGDALEQLKSGGLRVGIICDVGLTPSVTLRSYLKHHGLLGYFDHWSFSDDVGCYKPDSAIFAHALDGLGVRDPASMAHIGDLRRTDIAGAHAVGWLALRYCGLADDKSNYPEGDLVVRHHSELARAVGLG